MSAHVTISHFVCFMIGVWDKGHTSGDMHVTYPDGSKYEGSLSDELLKDGYGTMVYETGEIYCGQWFNDLQDGDGELTDVNSDVFAGSFVNGMREGFGRVMYANGDIFEGIWRGGKKHGAGTHACNGRKVIGHWEQDQLLNDHVEVQFKNGAKYMGEWSNGNMHGYGIYTYGNGDMFDGSFVNGLRHGSGVLIHFGNHKVLKGVWVNDCFQPESQHE